MSGLKRRLEKVEKETKQIYPPGRTLEDDLKWRLDDVRLYKRYFPIGSIMSSLNTLGNRKCFVMALENLQSPYREQVEAAFAEFAFHHPAKWLLQYVIYVGTQHYHYGAPLRIPDQVCDWLLSFDPIAYGYESDLIDVGTHDFCYDCGICYPTLDRPLVKKPDMLYERPFADKRCFDCSGPIAASYSCGIGYVSSPARSNYGWRERQEAIDAIELPESLQYETWDWEKLITEAFEAIKDEVA